MFESDKKKFKKDSFTTLLNSESYDTKKKLNRSKQLINFPELDISCNKDIIITSESLDKLNVPIYKYKTQITVHGKLSDKADSYIKFYHGYVGYYKSLMINKNGSLGIKYNCIDLDKKSQIADKVNLRRHRTSTADYLYKNARFDSAEKASQYMVDKKKAIEKHIDQKLFIGTMNLYSACHPFFGIYVCFEMHIRAIKTENVQKLIDGISEVF